MTPIRMLRLGRGCSPLWVTQGCARIAGMQLRCSGSLHSRRPSRCYRDSLATTWGGRRRGAARIWSYSPMMDCALKGTLSAEARPVGRW